MYCDECVHKGQNLDKGGNIATLMKFSTTYLVQPLLPIHSHYNDALQINRHMLKLTGAKRTRFTKEFLQEQILVLLLGANCVLPLPVPSEAYTSTDCDKKHHDLRFKREKQLGQLLPGYRAFQSTSE